MDYSKNKYINLKGKIILRSGYVFKVGNLKAISEGLSEEVALSCDISEDKEPPTSEPKGRALQAGGPQEKGCEVAVSLAYLSCTEKGGLEK